MSKVEVIGVKQRLGWDDDGQTLVSQRTQLITDEFKADLAERRHNSMHAKEGDHMLVARIPAVFVEEWMRKGFNIFSKDVKAKDIVKRLHVEKLDGFLATRKRV